jgi:4-amino-4-deoxychorismate lyase
LINADHVDYSYKSADREALKSLFEMKGKADDIIMVQNELITDSYYANLAFLKNDTWYTPDKPLLKGTFREKLVVNEKLVLTEISVSDLSQYEKVKIFNALTEWEMHDPVDYSKIFA